MDVGVEDVSGLLVGGFLHSAEQSVAGVVGHDVDPAERANGGVDGVADQSVIGDVGGVGQDSSVESSGERVDCVDVAGERQDVVATLGGGCCQGQSDAGRGAGDEPGAGGLRTRECCHGDDHSEFRPNVKLPIVGQENRPANLTLRSTSGHW